MVYELASYIPAGYHYYDTPDGQDCAKKMWFSSKVGALAGGVIGIYDVLLYSHPVGAAATLYRFGYWMGPLAMMGATYSVGTYMATNIRKEDDIWNHGIGGLIAGGIWGASRKSFFGGCRMGGAFAIAMMLIKDSYLSDYELFPTRVEKRWSGFFTDPKYDFTLTDDEILDPILYNEGFKNTSLWGG